MRSIPNTVLYNPILRISFVFIFISIFIEFNSFSNQTDFKPDTKTSDIKDKIKDPMGELSNQWLCRNLLEVRTLRVEKKMGTCSAVYSKYGLNQTILSSKNIDSCSTIALKVKGNLEAAGWKCKDISDSQITE